MTVILDDDLWILVLDHLCELAEECRLTDTSHILQADFLCTSSDELVGNVHIIFESVYRRVGDTERTLRSHATFFSPLDRRNDVAHIVQTIENTGDVCSLLSLYLIHKGTNIVRHRVHTKSVQTTIEHVGLDAYLIEWLTESANSIVRILTCQEVHLLKGATICLYTAKASHLNDNWSNLSQLVFAWLELTRALPHVSVNETELYLLFHNVFSEVFKTDRKISQKNPINIPLSPFFTLYSYY